MSNRRLYLGVAGFSDPKKYNHDEAVEKTLAGMEAIRRQYSSSQLVVISGYSHVGVPGIAYEIARKWGLETWGVACEQVLVEAKAGKYGLFPVNKLVIVGSNWGDDSPTFVAMSDLFLRVGGGIQALNEAKALRKRLDPSRVFEYDLAPVAA